MLASQALYDKNSLCLPAYEAHVRIELLFGLKRVRISLISAHNAKKRMPVGVMRSVEML
jgi:hypothetical protein